MLILAQRIVSKQRNQIPNFIACLEFKNIELVFEIIVNLNFWWACF